MNASRDLHPPKPNDNEIVGQCEAPGCGKDITRRMALEPGASAVYCSWEHAHAVRLSGVHGGLVNPETTEGGASL